MIHNTFTFGETHDQKCSKCGMRTALVSFDGRADIDEEPPEAKEMNIAPCVFVRENLKGHYCLKCECLTSISFNDLSR